MSRFRILDAPAGAGHFRSPLGEVLKFGQAGSEILNQAQAEIRGKKSTSSLYRTVDLRGTGRGASFTRYNGLGKQGVFPAAGILRLVAWDIQSQGGLYPTFRLGVTNASRLVMNSISSQAADMTSAGYPGLWGIANANLAVQAGWGIIILPTGADYLFYASDESAGGQGTQYSGSSLSGETVQGGFNTQPRCIFTIQE